MFWRSVLLSVAFWVAVTAVLRAAVIPPESCGKTDRESLDVAARAATDWIVRNQEQDGRYTYLYLVDTDTLAAEYNLVRHAGVTMSLYQSAGYYEDPETLRAADAGLDWLIDQLERGDGWAAPVFTSIEAPLGAAALMTVGLAERRLVTGDEQYDELMRELGRFMVGLQREDGGFHVAWSLRTDGPVTDRTSRYYPGEALWAIALLEEAFPEGDWDVAARRTLEFLVTQRDVVEDVSYPPLADQWLAYGLAEMAEWGLSDSDLAYARRLAARFGLFVRTEAQREGSSLGQFFRGRDARAAGLGTWVEALGSLWRLASIEERFSDLKPKLEDRVVCSAGIMAARQVAPGAAADYPRPELVQGAWISRGETRMDDQQHALSGLLYTLNAMDGIVQRAPAAPVFPVQ